MKLRYTQFIIVIIFIQFPYTIWARQLFPNEVYKTRYPEKVLIRDVNNDGLPDAVFKVFPFEQTPPSNSLVEAIINDGKGGVKSVWNLDGNDYWVDLLESESEPELPPNIQINPLDGYPQHLEYGQIVNGEFIVKGEIHGPSYSKVILVDWTQDGIDDLLVYVPYGFMIIPGNPDGTFDLGFIPLDVSPPPPPKQPWSELTSAGDLNEDGIMDDIYFFPSNQARVLFGNESGELVEQYHLDTIFMDRGFLYDFNNDRHLDLLQYPLEATNRSKLRFGNGDGTFQEPVILNLGSPGGGIVMGDFNGDGKPDIFNWYLTYDTGLADMFFISLGNGDGSFHPFRAFWFLSPKAIDSHLDRQESVIVDYNQDGKDDLWFKSYEENDGISGVWVNRSVNTSSIDRFDSYK